MQEYVAAVLQHCKHQSKHSTPPECYAGILSEDIAAAQSVAENMQSDFEQNLTPLELCAHKNHTAQKLFNDLIFQSCTAIRLMYELFQRAKWNPRASLGIKIILGLLKTFADNKIIEDLHSVGKRVKAQTTLLPHIVFNDANLALRARLEGFWR